MRALPLIQSENLFSRKKRHVVDVPFPPPLPVQAVIAELPVPPLYRSDCSRGSNRNLSGLERGDFPGNRPEDSFW
jgi:hypothetical protein